MNRRLALIGIAATATACAATYKNPLVKDKGTITFDQKRFIQVYESGKTLYKRLEESLPLMRAKGCFTVEQIAAWPEAKAAFRELDINVETITRRPDTEPNWELYFKAIKVVVGLLP